MTRYRSVYFSALLLVWAADQNPGHCLRMDASACSQMFLATARGTVAHGGRTHKDFVPSLKLTWKFKKELVSRRRPCVAWSPLLAQALGKVERIQDARACNPKH